MSHFKCQHARNWKFFKDRIISKNLWPPRSPDLTPADFFLWGSIEEQSVQKYAPANRTTQRRYTPRDWSRQRRHFGNSIPEFGETHSSVFGCERRPFSVSIMSRSCFASFPVCVYKFSSHYLNNIIFIDNSLGPLARESPCIIIYHLRWTTIHRTGMFAKPLHSLVTIQRGLVTLESPAFAFEESRSPIMPITSFLFREAVFQPSLMMN